MFKRGVLAAAVTASWIVATPAWGVEVGEMAPEIQADRWYNTPGPVSLAQLRGHVVVVEFWATYCGPCHAAQPKLAAIHERLGPKGMVLISMSDESDAFVAPFISRKPASYIISSGGDTPRRYGIKGIPSAFVIDRNGIVAWKGNPHEGGFEDAIERTMNASGSRQSHAHSSLDDQDSLDDVNDAPPKSRAWGRPTPVANSSGQRPFEGGVPSGAKKPGAVMKTSRPAQASAGNKQKSDAKVAARGAKPSGKTPAVAKSQGATGKAKSAKLAKKPAPARKATKRK